MPISRAGAALLDPADIRDRFSELPVLPPLLLHLRQNITKYVEMVLLI